jgi:hypothetical protein
MGAGREVLEQLLHRLVQQAVVGQLVAELVELGEARQGAVDQQVADLLEARLGGQLLDRVAAVAQDAAVAVDVGDGAGARAGVG